MSHTNAQDNPHRRLFWHPPTTRRVKRKEVDVYPPTTRQRIEQVLEERELERALTDPLYREG